MNNLKYLHSPVLASL